RLARVRVRYGALDERRPRAGCDHHGLGPDELAFGLDPDRGIPLNRDSPNRAGSKRRPCPGGGDCQGANQLPVLDLMIVWQMHRPPNLRRKQRLELERFRGREKLGSQPQPALPGRACLERSGAGLIECDRKVPQRRYSTSTPDRRSTSATNSGYISRPRTQRSKNAPGPSSSSCGASNPAAALEASAP